MGAGVLAYRDVLFTDTRQEHQGPHDGRRCPRIQRRAVHCDGRRWTSRWALASSHTETCCSLTQDKSARDLKRGARVLAYRDVLFTDTRQEHQGPHDGLSGLAYRYMLFTDTAHEHQGPHDGRSCPQDMSTRDLTMGARVLAYRDVLFTDTRQEHMGPHDARSCPRIQRRAVH
ncbi:hypothetical protein NDU88_000466 [Pleurodeles waltl]|uniref:Uncharacterized protein n=1 Tax=Pleurodeles waltl TaxID=8319 RepID=A0AAV7R4A4_PLEWA|nr:hypothetical protein NDU88_000460 [Pleurodeles waltl]KAJ1147606.1 hypothetical protein NDU88_000466 [Pleurodeles waltl]